MKKLTRGFITASLALSFSTATLISTNTVADAAAPGSSEVISRIDELIKEKQELINQKKLSRNSQEQRELGIKIGNIEREIQALKNGQGSSNSNNGSQTTPSDDVATRIQELIKEKQELIEKKRVSTNWQEQKELGIKISNIEREIQALKNGQGSSNSNNGSQTTPSNDSAEKIQELINQKQELINKKKASRDKTEQKNLGKQINDIEKQIKQLKKGK